MPILGMCASSVYRVGFLSRVISLRTWLSVRGSTGETLPLDEAEALDSRKSRVASQMTHGTRPAPTQTQAQAQARIHSTDTDTDTRQPNLTKRQTNRHWHQCQAESLSVCLLAKVRDLP